MITCERCNTENLDGSQYCDECGAVLSAPKRVKGPDTGPTDSNGKGKARGGAAADARKAKAAATSEDVRKEAETPIIAPSEIAAAKSTSAHIPAPEKASEATKTKGPHAKLVIHRGRSVGKEFLLSEDEAHIGRWDADGGIFPDIDLDSDDMEAKVSRRHARITRRGGQYYIEDLGSTNGTFINRGRRLLPGDRQPLRDGDEVIVGKTFLRFQVIK